MKFFAEICKLDQEQRVVEGYASTEALDSHNEVVKRSALEAALPEYLKYANVREMHGPSAVGVAHAASIDDKGLRISARIIDPLAWEKVRHGVYKGFSIGGRVTGRDDEHPHVITGLTLTEISLVDRPANPEAVIDVFKIDWIAKEGRRNSEADQEKLDAAHDAIVAAGAHCAAAKFAGNGDMAKLAQEATDLRKQLCDLSRENDDLRAELAKLQSQPAPAKGLLRAVAKADDVRGAPSAKADPAEPREAWFKVM